MGSSRKRVGAMQSHAKRGKRVGLCWPSKTLMWGGDLSASFPRLKML